MIGRYWRIISVLIPVSARRVFDTSSICFCSSMLVFSSTASTADFAKSFNLAFWFTTLSSSIFRLDCYSIKSLVVLLIKVSD